VDEQIRQCCLLLDGAELGGGEVIGQEVLRSGHGFSRRRNAPHTSGRVGDVDYRGMIFRVD
jgi:hypothetical protein